MDRLGAGEQLLSLLDDVEAAYGEFSIASLVIVVDVIADGPAGAVNPIVVHGSDPRRWVQLALLEQGRDIACAADEAREDEAADATDR